MAWNKDLSLCSITGIKNELKKQNIVDVKRITIRKLNQTINTNTYILTFNNPKPSPEIKIGYMLVKVEKYIQNPRRCYNYPKYVHLKKACTRKAVYIKCGAYEPDQPEETCKNNLHCSNCNESHRVDLKHCKIWLKERNLEN